MSIDYTPSSESGYSNSAIVFYLYPAIMMRSILLHFSFVRCLSVCFITRASSP
jgi:hypothetical protein